MSYGTNLLQGRFTSTGVDRIIPIATGVDWMHVKNFTTHTAGAAATTATDWYWQRGMAAGDALITAYTGAGTFLYNTSSVTLGVAVAGGFTLIDTSASMLSAATAVTAGTNVTSPVYTCGLANVAVGTIVRVYSTAHTNVNGIDFSVGVINAGVDFTMRAVMTAAPGIVAGANGFARVVAPNLATYKLFYPSNRTIANITQAANAVVTTFVDHGYLIGQTVRLYTDADSGMVEINGMVGTIVATPTANTFTIAIDTTGFTTFVTPTRASVPFTPAQCVPVGEDTAYQVSLGGNILNDRKENLGVIGMKLAAGTTPALSVAGTITNVMYWRAGKSENM